MGLRGGSRWAREQAFARTRLRPAPLRPHHHFAWGSYSFNPTAGRPVRTTTAGISSVAHLNHPPQSVTVAHCRVFKVGHGITHPGRPSVKGVGEGSEDHGPHKTQQS